MDSDNQMVGFQAVKSEWCLHFAQIFLTKLRIRSRPRNIVSKMHNLSSFLHIDKKNAGSNFAQKEDMRRIVLLAPFVIGFLYTAAETITLKECIAAGLANNHELLNARIDIATARIGKARNRSRLLPVVNGTLQFTDYMANPVNVTTGTLLGNDFPSSPAWQKIKSTQYNANAGVSLSVPVYNQSIFASVKVAEVMESLAELSYEKRTEVITMQICSSYYIGLSARELTRLMDENIERMKSLLDITKAMFEQGTVLETDLNRVDINLQALRTARALAETQHQQQLNNLRYLLDLSPDSDITLVPVEDTADTATANLTTEDHSLPDIRIAGEQIALSDRNIAAVRAGYLPAISFSAYAGGIDYNEHAGHLFRSGSWFGNCFIGLSVNIPIFDANSRRHRIRQIQNERAQAVNRLEMMENSAAKDFSNAILQVEQNSEAYTTQLRSYRQAQDVYAITLERYREGIGSMTALLQDEMQLRSAQSVCVQALCQYRLARLELLRLSGNLHTLSD